MEASAVPPGTNHTYINGFQLALSNADISAVFLTNNEPTLSVSLSYTTAKSLSVALNEMMAVFEKATNHTIMTSDEVSAGLEKLLPKTEDAEENE